MVLLLDLFSGSGSVSKVAKDLGFDVVSLDRDLPADLRMDIMDMDYLSYEPHKFDIIWASPPCTEYSRAKTTGVRDIEGANIVVRRTLDIIEHLKPKYWIIENPQTGLLKEQYFMLGIPFNDVDYCKYGMPYRKRTRLWNNVDDWHPKPPCRKDCDAMNDEGTRHLQVAQRGPTKKNTGNKFLQTDLYKVPSELIIEILQSCT